MEYHNDLYDLANRLIDASAHISFKNPVVSAQLDAAVDEILEARETLIKEQLG